ncbi:ThiJ/PfpI [Phlegmacium glaucopus]|nr:ThiJ/PfpI [Phlegmacium glaucopus]
MSSTLHIGLLLFPVYQWLDAAGSVDYLNNHSQTMLGQLNIPKAILDKAPIIVWHYISSDLTPVRASSGPLQIPSCTYANCPPLDYLVVPGTDPAAPLPEGCAAFLHERVPTLKALLTVCTGSMAIAQAGILDGLHVCSNKVALKMFAEAGILNKKVKWVGDGRWIVDGKVWSAAGITAGIDLVAEFARVHFDPEVVELAKLLSEYESNPAQPDPFAKILEGIKLNESEDC